MCKIILPVISQLLASIPLSLSDRLYHSKTGFFNSPVLLFLERLKVIDPFCFHRFHVGLHIKISNLQLVFCEMVI